MLLLKARMPINPCRECALSRTIQKLDLSENTSVSHQGLVHRKEYCGVLRWTMRLAMDPFRLLLISVAGWLNQQQQDVIDYLQEENRVLREQFGGKRLGFSDDQRRRLAVRAKKLGRPMLHELTTIVTPATLLGSPQQ